MSDAALVEALQATGGFATAAAARLGISRQTLYKRAQAAGLDRAALKAMRHRVRSGAETPLALPTSRMPGSHVMQDAHGDTFVVLSVADYASLRAQADRTGDAWVQQERIIATLTRELETHRRTA